MATRYAKNSINLEDVFKYCENRDKQKLSVRACYFIASLFNKKRELKNSLFIFLKIFVIIYI